MAERSKTAPTRAIQSAEAKSNFAQLVDDVYSRGTRYIIQRFDAPRAVLISLDDFQRLLAADAAGVQALRESGPVYSLGEERTAEEIMALLGDPTSVGGGVNDRSERA